MATQAYSSTALREHLDEVMDAARKDIVHITENGVPAFIFCSEEIFEAKIREAAEQAAYEARMAYSIKVSRRDTVAHTSNLHVRQ